MNDSLSKTEICAQNCSVFYITPRTLMEIAVFKNKKESEDYLELIHERILLSDNPKKEAVKCKKTIRK